MTDVAGTTEAGGAGESGAASPGPTGTGHRDKPWVMRTYSGHSTARASNELYRTNLAKGQTGLSIAFDLPTQIGYDPDSPEAAGEVGKVGVPVAHLGHMRQLLDQIPVESMNTSMTINATAAWLLGLYIANAEDRGVDPRVLSGTTQNDIVKEYLSRGTFIFPPLASRRLTVDTIAYTVREVPRWNPINVCSYHLQEAGATPAQEVAYALATAIGVLDAVRESGQIPDSEFASVVGRISFFVNAGVRFVEETCKMRAFTGLWDRVCAERYGVTDSKLRRFRYGVQVNSLGLTEAQPENNVPRIVLESLGVTLSKRARARALQLPAWNEALGLPRPWDQQWSLRIQQILAFESDLLEYEDIFDGSVVIEKKTAEVAEASWAELEDVLAMGGAFEAIDELKARLVRSQAERVRRIETGELQVVGVNCFTETADSPLAPSGSPGESGRSAIGSILRVDPAVEAEMRADVEAWRASRDAAAVSRALDHLKRSAEGSDNVMPATIELAHAGGTTGEWAGALRAVFGEYRAPTGVSGGVGHRGAEFRSVVERSRSMATRTGSPPRLLVAKPGLDGHSNGAEQIAVAARDAGFEVVYQGIRLSPAEIVAAARDEDVDIVGISILSGSHLELVPEIVDRLRAAGVEVPVVVGGIIPPEDADILVGKGAARVYTPKDFELGRIMDDMLELAEHHRAAAS
ncbi:MAG TPA: methylmalonyl-CoA mutase family protein [Acidimicrobiales bacterium]|jgi:(2R)-ethylmalonyl-CoA mutase|nr:methylmalonyl-CoA mutase family protein [Acidimicrobiales bacterium]